MKKYLVLGGSGFIGRNIVRQLCKENFVVVADKIENVEFKYNSRVSFMQLDFVKTTDFTTYLEGVNTVVHLISTEIPSDGTDNINKEISENVFPTINLLNSMVGIGVKNLLFVSSGGTIYGELYDGQKAQEDIFEEPICKYAMHKLMIEKYLHLYHTYHQLDYKILRLANPYCYEVEHNRKQGLIPILIDKMLSGEIISVWGDGENVRDYIYMEDVICAFIAVEKYSGEEHIFNVGTGKGYSINEIIAMIMKKLKLETVEVIYEKRRTCDVRRNVLNISLITSCTRWIPRISIEEGIARSFETMSNRTSRT